MISTIARSANLAPYVTATIQAVPNVSRPVVAGVGKQAEKLKIPPAPKPHNSYTLAAGLPKSFVKPTASISLAGPCQIRLAHTDVQVPDFSAYRSDDTKDANKSSVPTETGRKMFSYLTVAGGGVAAAYSAKSIVAQFVSTMSASADVLAVAKIEIKLSDIPEGKNATFKWRNKPLFVRHRSEDEIAKEAEVDLSSLRDPQHDSERAQKPEWLILLGVCTHLGCVPIANVGEFGGYYCPCHGSHYDASGRIRKGPAPLNLEVPEYTFVDEDTVVVG
jgi:ubiquinol-cytochrome c reductase iron-sulfur subunit